MKSYKSSESITSCLDKFIGLKDLMDRISYTLTFFIRSAVSLLREGGNGMLAACLRWC